MYDLSCPSCNTPSQFELNDFVLMCPFCSSSFHYDVKTGQKEIFSDHYIVPNTLDPQKTKELVYEWLKRLHHRAIESNKEFYVTDIRGYNLPYWVISLEGHTVWKGMVQKKQSHKLESAAGADVLIERGRFRRSYRWAISARENLAEIWGLTRLHQPVEKLDVSWDGFPMDSTFSRGLVEELGENAKPAYEVREFFDFKYANGLPILGVRVNHDEALRRAKDHVVRYHLELSGLNVDHLIDMNTELEVAGVQLIHLPVWHAKYMYTPRGGLRHFYKPKEKNVLINGYSKGILKGEIALVYRDKVTVNAIVCALATLMFLLLGALMHPAFFLVALFTVIVSAISIFIASSRNNSSPDGLKHGGLWAAEDKGIVARESH